MHVYMLLPETKVPRNIVHVEALVLPKCFQPNLLVHGQLFPVDGIELGEVDLVIVKLHRHKFIIQDALSKNKETVHLGVWC